MLPVRRSPERAEEVAEIVIAAGSRAEPTPQRQSVGRAARSSVEEGHASSVGVFRRSVRRRHHYSAKHDQGRACWPRRRRENKVSLLIVTLLLEF